MNRDVPVTVYPSEDDRTCPNRCDRPLVYDPTVDVYLCFECGNVWDSEAF